MFARGYGTNDHPMQKNHEKSPWPSRILETSPPEAIDPLWHKHWWPRSGSWRQLAGAQGDPALRQRFLNGIDSVEKGIYEWYIHVYIYNSISCYIIKYCIILYYIIIYCIIIYCIILYCIILHVMGIAMRYMHTYIINFDSPTEHGLKRCFYSVIPMMMFAVWWW